MNEDLEMAIIVKQNVLLKQRKFKLDIQLLQHQGVHTGRSIQIIL